MTASIQHTLGYLEYLIGSKTKHSVHSPFLFQFVDQVINGDDAHVDFERIEKIRSEMLNSNALVHVEDYGASFKEHYQRKLSSIVSNASKRAKYSKLLYRIVQFYRPQVCIELGTNVGISAMYQALALQEDAYLHTVEGSSSLAEIAQFNIEKLNLQEKVQVHHANFDDRLPQILQHTKRVDYAFIDGNHIEESTLDYFNQILSNSQNETIIVLDDINWSTGMQSAWMQIKEHPKVSATIDLYFIGIVFIRSELSKEHLSIRF